MAERRLYAKGFVGKVVSDNKVDADTVFQLASVSKSRRHGVCGTYGMLTSPRLRISCRGCPSRSLRHRPG